MYRVEVKLFDQDTNEELESVSLGGLTTKKVYEDTEEAMTTIWRNRRTNEIQVDSCTVR